MFRRRGWGLPPPPPPPRGRELWVASRVQGRSHRPVYAHRDRKRMERHRTLPSVLYRSPCAFAGPFPHLRHCPGLHSRRTRPGVPPPPPQGSFLQLGTPETGVGLGVGGGGFQTTPAPPLDPPFKEVLCPPLVCGHSAQDGEFNDAPKTRRTPTAPPPPPPAPSGAPVSHCGCWGPERNGTGLAPVSGRIPRGGTPQQPAQPRHTNHWAPQTRKRHQQEHRPNAATRRNMRREDRVTVQGPVKKQQPDGMSHRGGASPRVPPRRQKPDPDPPPPPTLGGLQPTVGGVGSWCPNPRSRPPPPPVGGSQCIGVCGGGWGGGLWMGCDWPTESPLGSHTKGPPPARCLSRDPSGYRLPRWSLKSRVTAAAFLPRPSPPPKPPSVPSPSGTAPHRPYAAWPPTFRSGPLPHVPPRPCPYQRCPRIDFA